MESQLVFGYMLYVKGQPMSVGQTLEESQEAAEGLPDGVWSCNTTPRTKGGEGMDRCG